MIDIDKLTEAQVRYILNRLSEHAYSNNLEGDMEYLTTEPLYPQQTNNEESDNEQQ